MDWSMVQRIRFHWMGLDATSDASGTIQRIVSLWATKQRKSLAAKSCMDLVVMQPSVASMTIRPQRTMVAAMPKSKAVVPGTGAVLLKLREGVLCACRALVQAMILT